MCLFEHYAADDDDDDMSEAVEIRWKLGPPHPNAERLLLRLATKSKWWSIAVGFYSMPVCLRCKLHGQCIKEQEVKNILSTTLCHNVHNVFFFARLV